MTRQFLCARCSGAWLRRQRGLVGPGGAHVRDDGRSASLRGDPRMSCSRASVLMVVPMFRRITKTTCSSPSSTTTCSTQSGWARKLSPSSKGSCRRMSTRGSVVSRYNSIYVDICSLIITWYILESWRRGGHKASSVLQGCEMEGFRWKEDKAAIQTKNCKYGFWFHPSLT